MSNIGAVLKSEIARLARKEIKAQIEPLKKANTKLRSDAAALKRSLRELEQQVRQQARATARPAKPAAGDEADAGPRGRITQAGIRTLRKRTGLSAEDFGTLVGATGQSVYNWENKGVTPSKASVAAMIELRGLGKREIAKRLEALDR
ncbi:MAG: hypothetical protein A2580_18085 [Hydrogenophilales bacterium RIFOXYD1_FULL_62_11]|nr:MAG: hypothetical protein A2580_18085 [Hydrogenophilales bacterium RIFOXYD1_FULL_62_11]